MGGALLGWWRSPWPGLVPRAATARPVGRRRQGQGKGGRHAGVHAARGGAAGAGDDAAGDRVLRPAGGAAHGGGAGQGAGTLLALAVPRAAGSRPARSLGAHRPRRPAEPRQRALGDASSRRRPRWLEAERRTPPTIGLAAQNFISPTALQTSQARARRRARPAQVGAGAARRHRASACARRRCWRRSPASSASATSCPGEKVSAEQQLLTIVDLGVARAGRLGRHARGVAAAARPGGAGAGRRAARRRSRASIDRIAPAAEAGTRAIGVVVALDNQGERFRAGQYAQARVELADDAERLTVPIGAVGQASGQDFVWAIENGALVRRDRDHRPARRGGRPRRGAARA